MTFTIRNEMTETSLFAYLVQPFFKHLFNLWLCSGVIVVPHLKNFLIPFLFPDNQHIVKVIVFTRIDFETLYKLLWVTGKEGVEYRKIRPFCVWLKIPHLVKALFYLLSYTLLSVQYMR